MHRRFWTAGAALVVWLAAGNPAPAQEPVATSSTNGQRVSGEDARVLPGDQIVLRIWREPELSGTFSVDEDGRVVLPRLGSVRVAEQSVGALQDSVRHALAQYLRNPSVEVTILRRVGVHGEVRKPDLYLIDLTMTLREVIAKAGGITEAGNPDKIEIIRNGERLGLDGEQRARFTTAELRSGDQVVVGRRSWIAMNPLAVISTGTAVVSFFVGVILPLVR